MFPRHIHKESQTLAFAVSQAQAVCQKYLCLHPTGEKKQMLCHSSNKPSDGARRGNVDESPSATTKLETIMSAGSTHLISAASRVWVTHWGVGFGYRGMRQTLSVQRDKYFSTPKCCRSPWEARLLKSHVFWTRWNLGGPQNYFQNQIILLLFSVGKSL